MKLNRRSRANKLSGSAPIPLTIVQPDDEAETYRDETDGAFFREDSGELYARDYFADEEERLGNLETPHMANKDIREWSDGLRDEENLQDDQNEDEELSPESMLQYVDLALEAGDVDSFEVSLRPAAIDIAAA